MKLPVFTLRCLCAVFCCVNTIFSVVNAYDEPVEYGVDVSFPMQYEKITNNYPWLEHNTDPSLPVPEEYEGMVLQPLGDKRTMYDNYLEGCKKHFGNFPGYA